MVGEKDLQRSKATGVIVCQGCLCLGSIPVAQRRQSKMENVCVTGSTVDSFAVFHGLGNVGWISSQHCKYNLVFIFSETGIFQRLLQNYFMKIDITDLFS